jgi:2-polyprenyl-6-methoxyphenol hydroxylase-like FAD-dependent oxidoreductase
VVDRARFPSDAPSTHGIQPSGVKILRRLGAADRLAGVAACIDRGTIAFDEIRFEVEVGDLLGAPMLNVRRITLDAVLVDVAVAAGADVRLATAVTGLVVDDGRVVGVRTRSGQLRAPLVVGADGVRSAVARLVGARTYHRRPCGRAFMWAYFEGATADDNKMWLGKIGDHAFLASATDANLFMVAVVPSAGRWPKLGRDREAAFAAGLREWPELDASVGHARRVGPIRIMSGMAGYLRESAGPGWVLVGDAGHFKDPTPGQGISDALRQADTLASAIERGLGNGQDPDGVLRDWWGWRDRDAWEMYRFAGEMGAPGPTPQFVHEVQRRLAASPKLTEELLRILNHDLPPSRVFTPRLAVRAVASGLRRGRGRRRALLRELRGELTRELRDRRPRLPDAPQLRFGRTG